MPQSIVASFRCATQHRAMPAKRVCSWLLILLAAIVGARAQSQTAQVTVNFTNSLGQFEIHKMALGQGGLSDRPMWEDRITEIRSLKPAIIRLFIQEYFDLLPERGRYHFDTLDRSVDTILAAGAKPLMCICFKPRVLFPQIDHDIVEPNDYGAWEELIFNLVRHYKERGAGIRYWEVGNEPDIGESGGCPYRFKPESYARYYQHTAAAILRADPDARVGGPALAGVKSPILPALLLSRLAGERLELTSSHPAVHGLAARDDQLRMFNVMLWNFSANTVQAEITFANLPRDLRLRHLTLDAASPSNDENLRLRPRPGVSVKKGENTMRTDFEAYGVQFWMFE
jgi:hypothetical protein